MSWGRLRRLHVEDKQQLKYSYRKVCESFGYRNNVLVDRISAGKLDCMGKVVAVGEFCRKHHGQSPLYTRGYAHRGAGVICEKGVEVVLEYECAPKKPGFCREAKNSCRWLGQLFARSLQLNKFAQKGRVLSCRYRAVQKGDQEATLAPQHP